MSGYTKLEAEVDAQADAIWDTASNVWTFAELGFEEEKSSAYESGRKARRRQHDSVRAPGCAYRSFDASCDSRSLHTDRRAQGISRTWTRCCCHMNRTASYRVSSCRPPRQREVFTTPLLSEANKRRNTNRFTRKKQRSQEINGEINGEILLFYCRRQGVRNRVLNVVPSESSDQFFSMLPSPLCGSLFQSRVR